MTYSRRIADYGIRIGRMKSGPRNTIADVEGVRVGHYTLSDGPLQTGVTAILPAEGNLFREKLLAACHVINGFGKSCGLVQIEELGTLETPILLTNTLSVGAASDALVRFMLSSNPDIGRETGTVNPAVFECNDGYLNDIRALAVREEHVLRAISEATPDFEEGAVGAGRGMTCYHLKGGIGSASRIIETGGETFTLGVLVLSNFGQMKDLTIDGRKTGAAIASSEAQEKSAKPFNGSVRTKSASPDADTPAEQGSIVAVIATDLPLTERQLKRVARRASVGITRTGAFIANGSGEIAIAFTTANRVSHDSTEPVTRIGMFNENRIDLPFRAAVEATEEAVLNSMVRAEPLTGRDGNSRRSLAEFSELFAVQ